MRAAVALYAFDWLGAEVADPRPPPGTSSPWVSHVPSATPNGVTRAVWGGKAQEVQNVRLTPATFKRPDWI